MSTEIASAFEAERMNIAVEAPETPSPSSPTRTSRRPPTTRPRHFDAQELAHLIWQIAAINAWNRIAVATRKTVGDYQP